MAEPDRYDIGKGTIDIRLYAVTSPPVRLRTRVVSGPILPKVGERITLEVVAVERSTWEEEP